MSNESLSALSDQELVARSLTQPDNFAELINRYQHRLLRYIRRISNCSFEEAEDILQDVFIKTYKNLLKFDQSLSFSSWIYRITRHETISHYRKTKARPQTTTIDDDNGLIHTLASDINIEQTIDHTIESTLLKKVIGQLDAKYRDVLVLKYFEQKSYEEISDIIKKPVGTVGTLINRAKKQLRKYIEKEQAYSTLYDTPTTDKSRR